MIACSAPLASDEDSPHNQGMGEAITKVQDNLSLFSGFRDGRVDASSLIPKGKGSRIPGDRTTLRVARCSAQYNFDSELGLCL